MGSICANPLLNNDQQSIQIGGKVDETFQSHSSKAQNIFDSHLLQDDKYVDDCNQQDLSMIPNQEENNGENQNQKIDYFTLLNPSQKQKEFLNVCQWDKMKRLSSMEDS